MTTANTGMNMKEKLNTTIEKLNLMQHPYANDGANKQLLEQSKTLLESAIAELESEEILERVVKTLNDDEWEYWYKISNDINHRDHERAGYELQAMKDNVKAIINVIFTGDEFGREKRLST